MAPMPSAVPVLAVLNILHALLRGLLCGPLFATNVLGRTGTGDPIVVLFAIGFAVLMIVLGVASIVASVGLLTKKDWGRRLSFWMAIAWIVVIVGCGAVESGGMAMAMMRAPDESGLQISRMMGALTGTLLMVVFHTLTVQTMRRHEVMVAFSQPA